VAALALLAWRGYGLSRWSLRPAPIAREDWISPIDLNQAQRADLRTIPGIGEKLADRIVAHRDANGPFASLDELRRVSGIGPATLTRLRPHLRIDRQPIVRGARPDGKGSPVGRKVLPASKVDLNRATAEQLRTLPNIGPTLATRILDARRDKPFRAVDDLRRVKGVGAKTLEKLRPFVEVK
jgi:competence protein ComEA